MTFAITRPFGAWHYPFHRNEGYAPVFIVGSGRSGNTLLRRMLQAGPDLHIPPETYVLGKIIRLYRKYQMIAWADMVHLLLSLFEFHPEFGTFEIHLRPVAMSLAKLPKQERSLARILDAVYRFHGEQTGQGFNRWGDKTPSNCFEMAVIRSVFPDAAFVHMVRDGVDAAVSYRESGIYATLIEGAERWRDSVRAVAAFEKKRGQKLIEVRYERLVAEPAEILSALCKAIGIAYSQDMIESEDAGKGMGDVPKLSHHENVMKPLTQSRVGRGRPALTDGEKRQLSAILDADLKRLGYAPVAG
jgi:protein-tyrosine sulfotransferase